MTIELFISTAIFTLITMIYFHIQEDFNQGKFLSKYKQRANWLKDEIGKDDKYKNDYKACLLIHSFKWSFNIMIPMFVFMFIMNSNSIIVSPYNLLGVILIWLIGNTVGHYFIDDAKANKMKINLVTDQFLHLIQIVICWLSVSSIYLGRLFIQI